jgi:hypothetical protein
MGLSWGSRAPGFMLSPRFAGSIKVGVSFVTQKVVGPHDLIS